MGSVEEFFKFPILPILDLATRKYIAGHKLEGALAISRDLQNKGFLTAVGYWSNLSEGVSRNILLENYRALTGIAQTRFGSCLSVQFTTCKMPSDSNNRTLETFVAMGQDRGVLIQLDSLGHAIAQRMWDEVEVIVKRGGYLGGTLPSRWKRSLEDASRVRDLNLRLRLVKGKRLDPSERGGGRISYSEIYQNFLKLIKCLAGRKNPVIVATHDFQLAQESLIYLQRTSTPCELELLYGVPSLNLIRWAKKIGVPVRFYIPYGKGVLPYSLSDFPRNPRLLWWFIKDAFIVQK